MAVLFPKGTKGFRIKEKFWNNKEPCYSTTSSFYVKAASLSVLLQDNYMYTVSTDVDPVDVHATCFTTIQFLICLKYSSVSKSTWFLSVFNHSICAQLCSSCAFYLAFAYLLRSHEIASHVTSSSVRVWFRARSLGALVAPTKFSEISSISRSEPQAEDISDVKTIWGRSPRRRNWGRGRRRPDKQGFATRRTQRGACTRFTTTQGQNSRFLGRN